jgi:putative ATP-binding cassette transporter
VGIFSALLSAITFIGVLWFIGGTLTVQLGGTTLSIPGFLVIAAVLYALLASGSMAIIGRRFVAASEHKNQAEAEYRYGLTRVREYGESIALLGGEGEERWSLDEAFRGVLRRWRALVRQWMQTTVVSQTSSAFVPVLPILLCAPKYVANEMTLGQVMQASSAFVIVQVAFNWLVDNYPRLADWTASARRLGSLLVSLDRLERADREESTGRIRYGESEGAALRLRNVSVMLDDGSAVVNEADVDIARGEKVLVVGESGTGKSTLVRAISGPWPWGQGEILIQPNARLFLMPQQPYVPLGTLRRAATYPQSPDEVDEAVIRKTLEDVGLGQFVDRLDEEARWESILSGGEKQRLVRPGVHAAAGHRGDGRGDGGARSVEPGPAHESAPRTAPDGDRRERGTPCGAGSVSQPEAGPRAPRGRGTPGPRRSAGVAVPPDRPLPVAAVHERADDRLPCSVGLTSRHAVPSILFTCSSLIPMRDQLSMAADSSHAERGPTVMPPSTARH